LAEVLDELEEVKKELGLKYSSISPLDGGTPKEVQARGSEHRALEPDTSAETVLEKKSLELTKNVQDTGIEDGTLPVERASELIVATTEMPEKEKPHPGMDENDEGVSTPSVGLKSDMIDQVAMEPPAALAATLSKKTDKPTGSMDRVEAKGCCSCTVM
jgi:hypothetical protein